MTRLQELDIRTLLIVRETALVALVILALVVPWFVAVGAVSWISLGALLAFALVFPRSLLLAVPFAVGISFKPFEAGTMQLNVLEVLILAAIVGYAPRLLLALWREFGWIRDNPDAFSARVMPDRLGGGIALLLLLAGVISLATMADADYARESLRTFRWTILFPVAWFLLAAPVTRRPDLRWLVAGLFLAGAVLSAVIAIISGISGGGVQADSVTRLSGLAPHPNALGLVLERAAVLGLLTALLFRDRINLWWAGSGLFVSFVILLTFSRGAVLGVLAGCLLILFISRARIYALAAGAAGLATIAMLALLAPDRILSFMSGGSGSLRLELWKSSLEMIRDHPITGVGLDQFLYQYLPRYVSPEAWPERFTSHPHNLMLDVWLSLGIIGAAILVLMGVLWVRRVRTSLASRDRISLAAAGALVAGAVHGLLDQSYFLPELAVSTWILIMLLRPQDEKLDPLPESGHQPKGPS